MIKLKHYIFISCFTLLSCVSITAQDIVIKTDSSAINILYFKDNIKERYSGSDFNYEINDTGGVNLIQSVFRKFFGWLEDIFGIDIDINYQLMEYIVYAILGIGVLFLLIKFLIQSPISSVFKTESRAIDSIHFTEETLTQTNFDKLIKKALKKNNFRLATRYHYLKSLKELSKKEIIKWNFDKTNSEYLNEIKDHSTKEVFKKASYIYDYIWYGEFPINETDFNNNQLIFNKLNKISNG